MFVYVFGKSNAFFHHEQKFAKRALLEFSLPIADSKKTGRTTSAISRNRAQFPANERTFEKWLFSNLAVPRAEIGKTSRFGFLKQKFARAEINVLLKLQGSSHMPKRWLHPGTACLTATRGAGEGERKRRFIWAWKHDGIFYAEYRLSTATKHPEHGRMMEIDVVLESGHALAGWARDHLLPTLLQNVPGAQGGRGRGFRWKITVSDSDLPLPCWSKSKL